MELGQRETRPAFGVSRGTWCRENRRVASIKRGGGFDVLLPRRLSLAKCVPVSNPCAAHTKMRWGTSSYGPNFPQMAVYSSSGDRKPPLISLLELHPSEEHRRTHSSHFRSCKLENGLPKASLHRTMDRGRVVSRRPMPGWRAGDQILANAVISLHLGHI